MKKSVVAGSRIITYVFEHKKTKNINLRVRLDGSVYVSAPMSVSEQYVEDFVKSKFDFIVKAIDRFSKLNVSDEVFTGYFDGDNVDILGQKMTVYIEKSNTNKVFCRDDKLVFAVTDKESISVRTKLFDAFMRKLAEKTVSEICMKVYPAFSERVNVFPVIKYRKMKNKWGICRPVKGILTFNTWLACADIRCIEYVVIHEFCHFIHANHSKSFYDCLEKYIPDWKLCKEELKKYSSHLIRKGESA